MLENARTEFFVTPPTQRIARKYADSYCKNVIFNIWCLIKFPNQLGRCYYAERIILDSGVNAIFEMRELDDYPAWYLENYFYYAMKLSKRIRKRNRRVKSIWVVIPDYPADLDKPIKNNVERTIANWIAFKKYDTKGVFQWLPSLQAKRMDFESFRYSIKKFKEVFGSEYPITAIGSVCKWKDISLIRKYVMLARYELKTQWIHAFGPKIKSLPAIKPFINSFDSITVKFHTYNSNNAEEVFLRYIRRIERWLSKPTLLTYFGKNR